MIRFGPSGIPLSCKGRTLEDGIKDVHKLGLTALEVQFLRTNIKRRPVEQDEVGLKAREVPDKFVIAVNRDPNNEKVFPEDLDKELRVGDMIHTITGGVSNEFHKFPHLDVLSKELDVKMSIHTPYYMKFTEKEGELVESSMNSFKYTAIMADALGADNIVTHLGLREEDHEEEDIEDAVVENFRSLRDWMCEHCENEMKIGIETQTGEDVFGTLDQVLEVSRQISGTIPILNFAHMKAEGTYELEEKEDFAKVFDKCKNFIPNEFYVNFSGVERRGQDKTRLTPIKRGDLQFEDFADYLIESDDDITIISTSPLKEHDAMYMKVIFERLFTREIAKELRQRRKDEE